MPNPVPALRTIGLALALGLLAACGQSGALYLPDQAPPGKAKKEPQRPAPPVPASPGAPAPGQ